MSSFGAELRSFATQVRSNIRDVVTEGGVEVLRSVIEGSELTGAPGQPVDTSALIGSWTDERISEFEWQTTTDKEYAEAVENGIQEAYSNERNGKTVSVPERIITFRSEVGGAHSVALTELGWQRIVDVAAARVTGGQ